MYKNDITPVQVFRNHLHLRKILNSKGTVLAYTKIGRLYTGIILLETGQTMPMKIVDSGKIKIGCKVRIIPCIQSINEQNLKEYGVIAKIYE
jgi:uncharacterized OB-fold protein